MSERRERPAALRGCSRLDREPNGRRTPITMALPAAAGLCRLHAAAAALLPGLATAVARGGVAAGELCAPSSSGRCSTPLVQLRQQHAERRPYGIVPPELLAELANIGEAGGDQGRRCGRWGRGQGPCPIAVLMGYRIIAQA